MVDLDHTLLIGRAGEGKSTYITQMSPEYLIMDFDRRWPEMKGAAGKSHIYTGTVLEVIEQIKADRPRLTKIGTIAVDSGSSVLDPLQATGRLKNEAGIVKNLNDVHKLKADTMRAIRGIMQPFNANTVWIFHIEDSGMSGKISQRTTISKLEVDRLKHNLNMILVMDHDNKGRFVKVEWSRWPDSIGHIIRDTNMWEGVPQRVHEFVRDYRSGMGYNGTAYSPQWLLDFLRQKSIEFASVEEMTAKLQIKEFPRWFDRNAWGKIIESAT